MKRKIKCFGSYNGHQSGNIYDKEGLSPALCCTDYKAPVKILETGGGHLMDKKVLDDNFCQIDKERYITTERERENVYAVTTRPRSRPLSKKQDNYVLEMKEDSIKLRESTEKGYKEAKIGDGIELGRMGCTHRRGVSHEDSTGALNTGGGWSTADKDFRIRKLTPVECERLQAFPDDWTKYGKDGELISDTQRYKCCGNAVTTTVITHIVNEMFKDKMG